MKEKRDIKKILLPILMAILAILLIVVMLLPGEKKINQKRFSGLFGTGELVSNNMILDFSGESESEFNKKFDLAYDTLKYYHELFDIYHSYEGVWGVYEINKNAGVAPVKVSADLIEFLEFGKEVYTLTGGEVNIAMGAVLSLWHDCREEAYLNPKDAKTPDKNELIEAAKHCDINKLIINREESTVYLEDAKMSLDVGAVGKGYAVEKAALRLKEVGADGYVLNVGGNIRIIGDNFENGGITTNIRDPFGDAKDYPVKMFLSDISAVTSGGYERYYTIGEKSYHHIIDKDTLFPSEGFASVTVLCKDSGLADALTTALFSMDEATGVALVEKLGGVEAVWIKPDKSIIYSSGMDKYVNQT